MKKLILLSLGLTVGFNMGCTHLERRPSSESRDFKPQTEGEIYQKLLHDSLLFFNTQLRNGSSGQYYDAISLNEKDGPDFNTSVAATGMGLVSLALGDAVGEIPQAHEKALKSLRFLLGHGVLNGKKYISLRSKDGWFRHWFDSRTGANNGGSIADGFSTIDTAILAAGSQLAAHYFSSVGKDPQGKLRKLADEILFSINWDSAVADLASGKLYMTFDLQTGQPKGKTAVFNEYILVAALGAYAEKKQGHDGKMVEFWNRYYRSPQGLPTKDFEGLHLLTDHPGHFLSSFTIQFAMYLCSDVASNEDYLNYAVNAMQADRLWFSNHTNLSYQWGMGAGEVRYMDSKTGELRQAYQANSLNNNPEEIVSPHIIAGFLPVNEQSMKDLVELYRSGKCLYKYKGYEFLWRCSINNDLPMNRLQTIDFSSMVLGLASASPEVGGLEFFQRHAPGMKSAGN